MHLFFGIVLAILLWECGLFQFLVRALAGLLALFSWVVVLTLIVVLICATVRAFQGKLFAHAHHRDAIEEVAAK